MRSVTNSLNSDLNTQIFRPLPLTSSNQPAYTHVNSMTSNFSTRILSPSNFFAGMHKLEQELGKDVFHGKVCKFVHDAKFDVMYLFPPSKEEKTKLKAVDPTKVPKLSNLLKDPYSSQ